MTIESARWFEHQKYLSLTNHSWSGLAVVGNGDLWRRFPSDLQDVIERNNHKYCAARAALRHQAAERGDRRQARTPRPRSQRRRRPFQLPFAPSALLRVGGERVRHDRLELVAERDRQQARLSLLLLRQGQWVEHGQIGDDIPSVADPDEEQQRYPGAEGKKNARRRGGKRAKAAQIATYARSGKAKNQVQSSTSPLYSTSRAIP